MSGSNRTHPRRVGLRGQAAPTIDIDIAPDAVDDLQRELAEFQDLREIMAYDGHDDGVDGSYGPRTFRAIALIAREAQISEADIARIDFRNKTGELYTRWQAALQNHHKEDETPQQVVERLEQVQGPQGPSPEELARAEAARRAAEEAARRAAEEAAIPAAIRGTEYDPRHIASLNQDERYALAVQGLFAVDELRSERSTPNLERIHDKMVETVRIVNRELGTSYPIPTEANPLSDEALEALGRRVALEGGIRGAGESIYRSAATQSQMNAAAATGLRALDRTSSGRYDPTDPDNLQRLQRNIRKFEREVMGLSGAEADGIADSAMIAALEQAIRERGGLDATPVTGGQVVTAEAAPEAPAMTPVAAALRAGQEAAARS